MPSLPELRTGASIAGAGNPFSRCGSSQIRTVVAKQLRCGCWERADAARLAAHARRPQHGRGRASSARPHVNAPVLHGYGRRIRRSRPSSAGSVRSRNHRSRARPARNTSVLACLSGCSVSGFELRQARRLPGEFIGHMQGDTMGDRGKPLVRRDLIFGLAGRTKGFPSPEHPVVHARAQRPHQHQRPH